MQVSEDLVRNVVQEVLTHLRNGRSKAPPTQGSADGYGVFADVDRAVAAATEAQRAFERRSLDERRQAVQCIRRVCIERADELGRDELEETRIGRLRHKVEKLVVAGEKTPGVEFLKTEAWSGSHGVSLQEFAPFGVI